MQQKNIRNFCIIAHIDHGKSTLCDRFLAVTKTITKREAKEQVLDQMDLERERGITIKLQPVKMSYEFEGEAYELNLIDTPGHVDFSYEVSRSLAAVEGAVLLIDVTQGIQAQTLANLYLAYGENLVIVPVLNKIDLPNAQVASTQRAVFDLIGGTDEILKVSAKTGQGVEDVLAAVIKKVPAPSGKESSPGKALIFDSFYDSFKGVIAYVRVFDGEFCSGEEILMVKTDKKAEILELGHFRPWLVPQKKLTTGQIGYIATGLKDIGECRVGDTIVLFRDREKVSALEGYKEAKPMVFASFYPEDGDDYDKLRDALDKLTLSDSSLSFVPESSKALGRGFRGGFLGLLHLEIIQERLRREFDLDLIFTTPSVEFRVKLKGSEKEIKINSPLELPDPSAIDFIMEPWVKLEIITISEFIGNIMKHLGLKRSIYKNTTYLDPTRAILAYEIPLAEVITNLHDAIKNISQGYGSISYEFLEFRRSKLVKLDILVAGEKKEELSRIVPEERSRELGILILTKLKKNLDRQSFSLILQAAVGGKIIARENISALRKDVLAKLYGGDRTRKDKLLKKQKKGKQKMKELGRVTIPANAYIEVMKS
jgi:GTP-binding protein LepA